jgi:hypothetical protein
MEIAIRNFKEVVTYTSSTHIAATNSYDVAFVYEKNDVETCLAIAPRAAVNLRITENKIDVLMQANGRNPQTQQIERGMAKVKEYAVADAFENHAVTGAAIIAYINSYIKPVIEAQYDVS